MEGEMKWGGEKQKERKLQTTVVLMNITENDSAYLHSAYLAACTLFSNIHSLPRLMLTYPSYR